MHVGEQEAIRNGLLFYGHSLREIHLSHAIVTRTPIALPMFLSFLPSVLTVVLLFSSVLTSPSSYSLPSIRDIRRAYTAPETRNALSGEFCQTDAGCKAGRACVDTEPPELKRCADVTSPSACVCSPIQLEECQRPAPAESPGPDGAGIDGDEPSRQCLKECTTNEECGEDAICDLTSTPKVCTDVCTSDDACEDGEVCAISDDMDEMDSGSCFARELVESSPGLKKLVCIDAEALRHLQPGELVYASHMMARVMCDESGSCATAGHMVKYKGVGMMMRKYCTLVGCVQRVMAVNSPRYKVGLRVRSRTAGLEYTALAARYESLVEERVLSSVVRLGF